MPVPSLYPYLMRARETNVTQVVMQAGGIELLDRDLDLLIEEPPEIDVELVQSELEIEVADVEVAGTLGIEL